VTVTKAGAIGTASYTLQTQFNGLNMNYVVSHTPQVGTITDPKTLLSYSVDQVNQSVTYFDGLGRSIQTVGTQASPAKTDIVQAQAYDSVGRERKKYLPFTSGADGLFKPDPLGVVSGNYSSSPQYLYYSNGYQDKVADDTRPFTETLFEPSPLNRPSKDFGPGQNWKNGNKYVGHQYLLNGSNDVYLFVYDPIAKLVSQSGFYAAGQLHASVTTDENSHNVIEYVDKLGHTVCKKVQSGTGTGGNKLYASTYYIYDDFGNLVVVLPPEAINSALNSLTSQN
jgi:hypothetical protein